MSDEKPTLLDIVRVLQETYKDPGVLIWLTAKNKHLASFTPTQFIGLGRTAEVYEVACRIEGGAVPTEPTGGQQRGWLPNTDPPRDLECCASGSCEVCHPSAYPAGPPVAVTTEPAGGHGESNPCGRCCWPSDCANGCVKPPGYTLAVPTEPPEYRRVPAENTCFCGLHPFAEGRECSTATAVVPTEPAGGEKK